MPPTLDQDLDPLEQLISDCFKASEILKRVYGPYFTHVRQPQGLPYCLIRDDGGGPNLFAMGRPGKRSLIEQPNQEFSLYGTDRAKLRTIAAAIDVCFEAKDTFPTMKNGSVCISAIPILTPWRYSFVRSDSSGLHVDVFKAVRWFEFRIERVV